MLLGKVSQLQTAKIEQAIYFIHCFSPMCTMVFIKILHENYINYMWELAYPILTNHTFPVCKCTSQTTQVMMCAKCRIQ